MAQQLGKQRSDREVIAGGGPGRNLEGDALRRVGNLRRALGGKRHQEDRNESRSCRKTPRNR
jgi:hypothetical protein